MSVHFLPPDPLLPSTAWRMSQNPSVSELATAQEVTCGSERLGNLSKATQQSVTKPTQQSVAKPTQNTGPLIPRPPRGPLNGDEEAARKIINFTLPGSHSPYSY